MAVKRLVIVRHGNTFAKGEPSRRIGARTDLPLTAEGEEQARRLGAWFAERRFVFHAARCGPLQRSRRTASLLLARLGTSPPLSVAAWLDEIDHGVDEGHDERDVVARVGLEALQAWDQSAIVPPGWPVSAATQAEMWRDAIDALPKGTTLLVTSGGAARFAVMALVETGRPRSLKLRTGAAGEILILNKVARLLAWDVRPGDTLVD